MASQNSPRKSRKSGAWKAAIVLASIVLVIVGVLTSLGNLPVISGVVPN